MRSMPAIATDTILNEISWRTEKTLVDYETAQNAMAERVAAIRARTAAPQVWLLEHPPLYTAGTSARPEDLFNPRGFPTYAAGRGGQWTYHGPGQRIAYVMLDLANPSPPLRPKDVRAYVASLEAWLIETLRRLDVVSFVREGRVGVWTHDVENGREAKIAAIGVRISRWVSWHGVSINCDPDLSDFGGIVPCGLPEFGVTSLAKIRPDLTMADLDRALAEAWPVVFGSAPCPDLSAGR